MSLPKSALYINFKTLLNPVTAFFNSSRKPTAPTAPRVNCKKTNNKNVQDHIVVTRDPFAKIKKYTMPIYLLHISQAPNNSTEWFDLLLVLGKGWITSPQRNKQTSML